MEEDNKSLRDKIINYVREKYNTTPEYLWQKYPSYAVLRHHESKKWYALIADIDKEKLGIKGKGKADIINVKCDKEKLLFLLGEKGIFPAYHMNKENWATLILDGTLKEEEIFDLIKESYDLTK